MKIFAVSDDGRIHAKYYAGNDADEQRSSYEMFYSALVEKFGIFAYDNSLGVYVTTVDITINYTGEVNGEAVQETMVMSNTKVTIDSDGNVVNIEFDYSDSVEEEISSSGKGTMEFKDYGTTVITAEEIEAAQKANV